MNWLDVNEEYIRASMVVLIEGRNTGGPGVQQCINEDVYKSHAGLAVALFHEGPERVRRILEAVGPEGARVLASVLVEAACKVVRAGWRPADALDHAALVIIAANRYLTFQGVDAFDCPLSTVVETGRLIATGELKSEIEETMKRVQEASA